MFLISNKQEENQDKNPQKPQETKDGRKENYPITKFLKAVRKSYRNKRNIYEIIKSY